MHASLSLRDVGLTPALGGEVAGVQAGVRSVQSVRDLCCVLWKSSTVSFAPAVVGIVWVVAPLVVSHWLSVGQLSVVSVEQFV